MRTGLVTIALAALLIYPCLARIITVDDDGQADFDNIQAAIDDANNGDIIEVMDGTYTGVGNRDIDYNGLAVTVKSKNGPDNCIIDCQGTASQPHRGFTFQSAEDANSILNGFTIQNGYGLEDPCTGWSWTLGGAVYCKSSGPTIKNCIIKNNEAIQGAGICALENSFITVTDCNISQNIVGCGIFLWENCSAVIKNCEVSSNGRRGIGSWYSSYLKIFNCRIMQNDYHGISCSDYNIEISNCVISDNSDGGIICNVGGEGNGLISNCLVTKNSGLDGGGISASTLTKYGDILIINCTITENYASNGGGISCACGNVTMQNSIVQGNEASGDGNDTYVWQLPLPPGESFPPDTIFTIEYSNPGIVYASDVNIVWGPGNIDVAPLFADILNEDYHLQSAAGRWDPNAKIWVQDSNTSPCIDAGNPGCSTGDEPNDTNNVRINMGAYGGTAQASKTPAGWRSLADLTNDWKVDIDDVKVLTSYWLMTGFCLPGDLDRNSHVDFKDFAIFGNEPYKPRPGEPGIFYSITPCDLGLSSQSAPAEQTTQTRFTVTVNGHYIHFEDMMVANCCTPISNLWLEMEINGNLITIYEREELPQYPCFCICDYPVDANLGPFQAGTYTLEVYEDWGGFIGQTTFNIE